MARKVRILKKAATNLQEILKYLDQELGKPPSI